MRGTLYGVGVGPGNPGLLTLAAVEVIERSGVIALPDSGGEEPLALTIVREYVKEQRLLYLEMPMTRDRSSMEQCHDRAAETVCKVLDEGEDVAFLTLGDPGVYSTYQYLHRRVVERGYDARIIPGVTSFCAAAAALGEGICEGAQPLHVIPAAYGDLEAALDLPGAKVLMKSGGKIGEIKAALEQRGLLDKAMLAERCGLPGQRLVRDLRDAADSGYFTTLLIKE